MSQRFVTTHPSPSPCSCQPEQPKARELTRARQPQKEVEKHKLGKLTFQEAITALRKEWKLPALKLPGPEGSSRRRPGKGGASDSKKG